VVAFFVVLSFSVIFYYTNQIVHASEVSRTQQNIEIVPFAFTQSVILEFHPLDGQTVRSNVTGSAVGTLVHAEAWLFDSNTMRSLAHTRRSGAAENRVTVVSTWQSDPLGVMRLSAQGAVWI